MLLKRFLKIIKLCLCVSFFKATDQIQNNDMTFIESFVQAYGFNAAGRYGHEYHPAILDHTTKSMHELESTLEKSGLNAVGRYVLMGYEGNAFKRFFPRLSDCEGRIIDDETAIKDVMRGWSAKLHNKFGATTGFLFRNVAEASIGCIDTFQHVKPSMVEMYGSGIRILQEITFGKFLPIVLECERMVLSEVEKLSWREAFEIVTKFWQKIYSGEIALDSEGQGTQDILFAIANAKFITQSKLDLIKFYTGADVTYPISTSTLCQVGATENAQRFLKIFIKELVARNNQNTVYIFRSFVDGVGKSTLLGNIINYLKFGTDVDRYEPVDNTSSLDFDLFEFKEPELSVAQGPKIFIADMPAQMSHFVCKPEGMVYVDTTALSKNQERWAGAINYFLANKDHLESEFKGQYLEILALTKSGARPVNWCFDQTDPGRAFACNSVLLKNKNPLLWTPFEHEGKHFLAKSSDSCVELKVLLEIKDARSEGLKNADPSQMIFSSGVRFPANYQLFLKNFVSKLTDKCVKNVVFVDFLSMYSRSSRENIRINYILQAMAHLNSSVEIDRSPYRHFISDCELLYLLKKESMFSDISKFLSIESIVRLIFHKILCKSNFDQPTSISGLDMHLKIVDEFGKLEQKTVSDTQQLCDKKVLEERECLQKIHGQSKEFVNVYGLDFNKVKEFSDFLAKLFEFNVQEQVLSKLWKNCSQELLTEDQNIELNYICPKFVDGSEQKFVELDGGQKMRVLAYFSPEIRDQIVIDKVTKTLRLGWVFAMLNLLCFSEFDKSGPCYKLDRELIGQLPVVLKKDKEGNFWMLEKSFEGWEVKTEQLEDGQTCVSVLIDGADYQLDCYHKTTNYGFLGLGHLTKEINNLYYGSTWYLNFILEDFYKDIQNKNKVMSISSLWTTIFPDSFSFLNDKKKYSKDLIKQLIDGTKFSFTMMSNMQIIWNQIYKFGCSDLECESVSLADEQTKKLKNLLIDKSSTEEQFIDGIDFFVSILATMHYLLPDPEFPMAAINKTLDEFQAMTNIIRFAVLPQHLGIYLSPEQEASCLQPVIPINFSI